MYKCVEDGNVTYQGAPCSGSGTQLNEPPADFAPSSDKGTGNNSSANAARLEAQAKALTSKRRLRDIDYEVKNLAAEITEYQSAMKSELDALQQQKDYWKNQLGGSLRGQAISDEMQKVTEKYNAKIQTVQGRINELNQEKTSLGAQVP